MMLKLFIKLFNEFKPSDVYFSHQYLFKKSEEVMETKPAGRPLELQKGSILSQATIFYVIFRLNETIFS